MGTIKSTIRAGIVLLLFTVLFSERSEAMSKKPAGFVPDCAMVTAGCTGNGVTESDIPSAAGCGPGKFRGMRYDTDVQREQKCFNMASCGDPANMSESWGVCQYYSGNVVKYKCLKFSANCP